MQNSLFAYEVTSEPNKALITTPERFERLIRWLSTRDKLVIDYETSGLLWARGAESIGMGLGSWDDQGRLWCAYVPYRHRTNEGQLPFEMVAPALKALLSNNALKIAHNIKFEDHFSRREGWVINGPRYDTIVACRLYDENRFAELEYRAETDMGKKDARRWNTKLHGHIQNLANGLGLGVKAYLAQCGYAETAIQLCGQYCCTDIENTALLYQFYENGGLSQKYSRICPTEMRLTEILCTMEENGLPIDQKYLSGVKWSVEDAKVKIEAQLNQFLGGFKVKFGSDDEVRDLLWNRMGLRWEKRTKKNKLSVDNEVLSEFASNNAVCALLIKWRDADKLCTTYTQSILDMLDSKGVLHSSFQQLGTVSGRLSCQDPNFQNFPCDDDDRAVAFSGKKLEDGGIDPWSIHRAFPVRQPGWVRLFPDYSQIELRVIAYYSGDPVMVDAYTHDEDIHARTAKEISALTGKDCPRRVAKITNFGISYGIGDKGLSVQSGVSLEDAALFLKAFFARYTGVAQYRDQLCQRAKAQNGEWTNIFGRTRRIPELLSPEFWQVKRAERQMMSSAISGTAAELTKESLVRIDDWIKQSGLPVLLCNTVHDEIQIDCPKEIMMVVAKAVKERMEYYPEFAPIPIKVDIKYSEKTWADKTKLKGV